MSPGNPRSPLAVPRREQLSRRRYEPSWLYLKAPGNPVRMQAGMEEPRCQDSIKVLIAFLISVKENCLCYYNENQG